MPALKRFKPFKPIRRPFQGNSRSYTPQSSVFKCVKACRLPALKPLRRPFHGNSRSYTPQPSVFQRVQACRLPALKPFKPPSNHSASLSKATLKPAVCPPSNPSSPSNPSASLSKATLAATRPSHLFLRVLKPAVCPPSNPSNPSNPSAGLFKATLAATRTSLFLSSSLPFARPQTLQTPPQAFPRQPFKPLTPVRKPFQGNSRYTPQPSIFKGVHPRSPQPPHPFAVPSRPRSQAR